MRYVELGDPASVPLIELALIEVIIGAEMPSLPVPISRIPWPLLPKMLLPEIVLPLPPSTSTPTGLNAMTLPPFAASVPMRSSNESATSLP